MNVELGGGDMLHPFHPNIDLRPLPNTDIVHDLETGIPLRDNCADKVNANHLFQHLRRKPSYALMHEVYRILKPGGLFMVRVNDLDRVFGDLKCLWQDDKENAWKLASSIWGDQDYPDDLHMCGYNYSYLEWLLAKAGFTQIERRHVDNIAELLVYARKPV